MSTKLKIYRDSGANINFLKPYLHHLAFYQYPYDSADRPKKLKPKLAEPSAATWEKINPISKDRGCANSIWEESNFAWNDYIESEIYDSITKLIEKHNQRDILHIDS